jgi:hypothetical protein
LKKKSVGLALVVFVACLRCGAQGPANKDPENYRVLQASRLVTASEVLSNADANCAIGGAGREATMQCQAAGGTAKASYHFNIALVLDGKGTAYVIACRLSLVAWWCKPLQSGALLRGNFDNGHLAISDGQKFHDYQVVISKYVGPVTPIDVATWEQPTPAAGAATRPEKPNQAPAAAEKGKNPLNNRSNPPPNLASDPATCMSYTGACVAFVSEPLGADIYVDNKFVGNTPSTLALAAGSHEIRVEAPTRKPWSRTLEAVAGSRITIRAVLEPLPDGRELYMFPCPALHQKRAPGLSIF